MANFIALTFAGDFANHLLCEWALVKVIRTVLSDGFKRACQVLLHEHLTLLEWATTLEIPEGIPEVTNA